MQSLLYRYSSPPLPAPLLQHSAVPNERVKRSKKRVWSPAPTRSSLLFTHFRLSGYGQTP